jgi:NAD(P)-dependent dehydrogenase (short-subunit alcohol dehydrogenase family)|tara:strand:- start:10283 stop:11095 length:813 start_codon:yes stop_codon:yes gene_type:complete
MQDKTVDPISHPLDRFAVEGKSAIVTGASGALGAGVAKTLGAMGVKLTLASGGAEPLEELARQITEAGGVVQTVNRRPDSIEDAEAIADRAVEAYGSVDLLVVASGFNQAGFIHEQDLADWEKVMDANVRGAWLMAQAFGKRALEQKTGGKVLLISSVRGRHGNYSGYTAYCTSKGATDALTRSLATEWAQHGITVNAIAPTVFRSGVTDWMFGDDELGQATRKRSLSRIPLGRLGEVDDLLGMAIYLLSPASNFCTGQIMYIDGGYTAG